MFGGYLQTTKVVAEPLYRSSYSTRVSFKPPQRSESRAFSGTRARQKAGNITASRHTPQMHIDEFGPAKHPSMKALDIG